MKVACIQVVSNDVVSENLSQVESLLETSNIPFDLLALPENFALMTDGNRMLSAERLDSGPIQEFISECAIKYRCWIQSGTIPIQSACDGKIYAAASLYSPSGERVHTYNKRFLFDVTVSESEYYRESDFYLAGSEAPKVIETDIGRVGIIVCYDLRFSENIVDLIKQNVEMILVPSAFTFNTGKHHWLPLLKARAIETQSFVIGANQGGLHFNGRHTYGHSAGFDPFGRSLFEFEEGPAIQVVDCHKDILQDVRAKMPMAHSRRSVNDA